MDWTDEDRARLREWWPDQTISEREMARRLGRTISAVMWERKQLRLPPRPSPIREAITRPQRARLRGSSTLPPLRSLQDA